MKKTFRAVALALAVAGSAIGLSSCDSESLPQILSLVSEILQGQQTNYRSTTCYGTYYILNSAGSIQEKVAGVVNKSVDATVSCNTFSQTISVVLGSVQVNDSISISGAGITSMLYTANSDQTQITLNLSDNSTVVGTLTINGKTYDASNLSLNNGTITESGLTIDADVYFDNDLRAVNVKFVGPEVSQ